LLIAVEVISCSGGFWSVCWPDVIAKMVAVPVPNAAFERLLPSAVNRRANANGC
jgi:hypothetical protein